MIFYQALPPAALFFSVDKKIEEKNHFPIALDKLLSSQRRKQIHPTMLLSHPPVLPLLSFFSHGAFKFRFNESIEISCKTHIFNYAISIRLSAEKIKDCPETQLHRQGSEGSLHCRACFPIERL